MINSFITKVLYNLGKLYASKIQLVKTIPIATTSTQTGLKTTIKVGYDVKAIVLPPSAFNEALARLGVPALGEAQYYDNIIIVDRRLFEPIIDTLDEWHIIYADLRYQIITSSDYIQGRAYLLKVKAVRGAQLNRVFNVNMVEYLEAGESVVQS